MSGILALHMGVNSFIFTPPQNSSLVVTASHTVSCNASVRYSGNFGSPNYGKISTYDSYTESYVDKWALTHLSKAPSIHIRRDTWTSPSNSGVAEWTNGVWEPLTAIINTNLRTWVSGTTIAVVDIKLSLDGGTTVAHTLRAHLSATQT